MVMLNGGAWFHMRILSKSVGEERVVEYEVFLICLFVNDKVRIITSHTINEFVNRHGNIITLWCIAGEISSEPLF